MLNWWLGRPADGSRDDDQFADRDPPETPAPVFAARALKSAIFGAPASQDDDTIYEIETESKAGAGKDARDVQRLNLSPTKPSGILLTPGTATTRRKTVSFGNEVVDKDLEKKITDQRGTRRSRSSDDGEKQTSTPFSDAKEEKTRAARKTSLTRALEKVRAETPKVETTRPSREMILEPRKSRSSTDIGPDTRSAQAKNSQESSQPISQQVEDDDNTDLEMTVDLKFPRSQSGKFWKAEYQQYHENALLEMKKVLAYKELAKSYAKHKDAQNIELAKRLEEAQKQVKDMEDKMFELSARITLSGKDGNGDDAPELVQELARQAALGVQYKAQVEEFRAALEGGDNNQNSPRKHARNRRASRETDNMDSDAHRELKRLHEQLKAMSSMRDEISSLRQTLSSAEKSVQKLQDENGKLTQQLLHADLRLERHLEQCEQKRRSFDEQRQKRDEILQNLQKDYDRLKEQAKSQRRDAEQLLKKRHDQVVDLKREIASLRGADTNALEHQRVLREKTVAHDRTVGELQKQIEDLKNKHKQDTQDTASLKVPEEKICGASSLASKPLLSLEVSQARESQIPVLNHSVSRPSKVLMPSRTSKSETPTGSPMHPFAQSALSEYAKGETGEPTPFQRSGPVQHTPLGPLTPLTNRFSARPMDSPENYQSFAEPSLPLATSRAVHDRNCRPSPGPSMFNIASSPPKAARVRPRIPNELSRKKSQSSINSRQNANVASSRVSNLDSSRVRNPIPPERVAAARARLEKKQAEKRRAQALEADKENTPSRL